MSTDSWWEKGKAILRALLIIAVIFGILWAITEMVWLIGIKAAWSYVVDTIQEITGVNTFLARAIVTVGIIPLIWGVVDVFSFRSKRRNFALSLIALYIILFNAAMYTATRNQNIRFSDGEVMRYCAVTPKEVYCADKPGYDPTYGIKLEPMTPDRVRLIEAFEKKIASGNFNSVELTRNSAIFDPVTGEAVLFYEILPNGEYRFFNGPGFDATTGTELKPVTSDVVQNYWSELDETEKNARIAELAKQKQQLQLAREQEIEKQQQVQTALLEEHKAELGKYFNSTTSNENQLDIAVGVRKSKEFDRYAVNSLIDALGSHRKNARFHDDVFRTSFIESRKSDPLFGGNMQLWKEARKFGLLPNIDKVLMATLESNCAQGFQDTIRCDVTFEYSVFDSEGNPVGNEIYHEIGAGFDPHDAANEGFNKITDKLRNGPQIITGI